jgi:hypothetical protein
MAADRANLRHVCRQRDDAEPIKLTATMKVSCIDYALLFLR